MSEDKKDNNEQVRFLGRLVDLKQLVSENFWFIRVSNAKGAPKTLINLKYPTIRRTDP